MTQALKAKLFRGFADPSRLMVLEMLQARPLCVSELVKATGLSQPNVSMHLACLRDCGLVRARRDGRFVHYALADPAVSRLLRAAEQVLKDVARRIAACPRYETVRNGKAKRTARRARF